MKQVLFGITINLLLFTNCLWVSAQAPPPPTFATIGKVVQLDAKLKQLLPADASIEIVAAGFGHLEGPVWVKDSSYLLVNDTKAQTTYKWSPKTGLEKYLEHNGYTGRVPYSDEPGSNGMTVDRQGRLLICDHGDRRIAYMPTRGSVGKRTLADNFQGKRFNSPNDLIRASDGSVYFSDPPYGLPLQEKDPTREITVNGVYRIAPNGAVSRVISDMTYPNGLAFSPDGKTLYVSQSDSLKAYIFAYPVQANGSLGPRKTFFDGNKLSRLPKQVIDGLKVDRQGNCWAAGPGGLLIISPAGKLLGRIDTGEVISNCAWGDDGTTLYIASSMFLCRIKTTVGGPIPGGM